MRKTYAYNGITIGILLGLMAGLAANNMVIGVIAMIGLSVLAFAAIRLLENAVGAGVDKASDAISRKIAEHKDR